MEKYWLVYVDGERAPIYKHPAIDCAKTEAERLARQNPGKAVAVLEAMCVVRVDEPILPPCKWEDAVVKIDDMPF